MIPPITSTSFTLLKKPVENSSTEVRFLCGLDTSYNGETRAFVLRQHFRRKRGRTMKRRPGARDDEDKRVKMEDGRPSPSARALRLGSENTDIRQLIPSPVHMVGQTRADPFQSCVKMLTGFEQEMFDRCKESQH